MAYAAVLSLMQTMEPLLKSTRVSIVPESSREMLEFVYEQVLSLKEVLKTLNGSMSSSKSHIDRANVNALDGEIRDAVCEFEDALEFHLCNRILQIHPLDLKQDIDSFTQKANEAKAAYIHELNYPLPPEESEEEESEESKEEVDDENEPMVGLSDQFEKIKAKLMRISEDDEVKTLSLAGMAGIGKTALAKKLYRDPEISDLFERRAFVTLGPKFQFERVLRDITTQAIEREDVDDEDLQTMEGETSSDALTRIMRKCLTGRRYLIVLDDVWNFKVNDQFVSLFPENNNCSRVLFTTRLEEVAKYNSSWFSKHDVRFLNKKESWDLLRQKVFDETPCPHELEEAGNKIAENCEGIPLTIVTVADILSRSNDKTLEYWNMVAANKQNSVFIDAYEQMFEVLYPSYEYLPQHLKPCFLYMAVFPQNYEIPFYKLVRLWNAEGFLEMGFLETPEYATWFTLDQLYMNNVATVHEKSLNDITKTCGLYSPFWHLCNKEATKIKFFRGLNTLDHCLVQEDLKGQRRLCIRNNVLFGIKDAYDSIASVSTVRSLLCTGPYHQYPVPVCLEYLRLLRILDALTILFYEFPMQVTNLVRLRYLSLTLNGDIPDFISKLWNLQYLIVHRCLSIVESDGKSPYLPMEIWDMEELKHLHVMGSDLPDPHCEDSLLPNLSTLLDVSPQSCTKDVFERIPNLRKLGIRIESTPDNNDDDDKPLCCFDHISNLDNLETLKCATVNPRIMLSKVVAWPPTPLHCLPSSLVTLSLSGFGFAWKELSKISSLPNLRVLKLKRYAFRGPDWEVCDGEFPCLQYLLIEDTDLKNWTFRSRSYYLPRLESLVVRHCYKLEDIPQKFGSHLKKIELVDCNPLALDCIDLEKTTSRYKGRGVDLSVRYSWD
ncbi:hypothetical protein ABFS83_04G179200 [Erythranthe nasuta]